MTLAARGASGSSGATLEISSAARCADFGGYIIKEKLMWSRDQMAERAVLERADGHHVNVQVGIPKLVSDHITEDITSYQCGKRTITELLQTSYFSSSQSFARIQASTSTCPSWSD